jgi:two-component system OmpR family sensor kinase
VAGWSLRTRLVVSVVALLSVVCLATGGLTTLALRHYLTGQLDQQLGTALGRVEQLRGPVPPVPPRRWAGPPPFPPGSPAGAVSARLVGGRVVDAAVFDPDAEPTRRELTVAAAPGLAAVPVDGRPRTRNLGALGDYRLLARTLPDGGVLVVGLPLAGVRATVWSMVVAQAVVAGAGLLVAGSAGALVVRAALRPLRRVAVTAGRVAELPLDRGEVALSVRVPAALADPRTEVGQVGAALNRMLGHVAAALAARHASETRVRQFVADASHELRTPLAAVRGYAELARRGPDEVPPDVAYALRRVESAGARMTRLVDDLLLLARLDAGRPLRAGPVDLSALVVDAVSDARVAGPGHRWRLRLPADPVRVTGDAERLHQVVANLLANARTHTPAGSTVTTALSPVDAHVALTVTDDGPGIPPELRPEVFERFVRGDSSRSRETGSTGLGLAIVAAVVDRHRGTVSVDSRPGRTVFQVRLPLLTADA